MVISESELQSRFNEFFDTILNNWEFYKSDIYSLEDHYQEYPDQRNEMNQIITSIEQLRRRTDNFTQVDEDTLANAIYANPRSVKTLRFLTGQHETTFRLFISPKLYEQRLCDCAERPGIHGEAVILRLARRDRRVAKEIAKHFMGSGISKSLEMLSAMRDPEIKNFVKLINIYQTKQRLAKLRGHMAEKLVAIHFDKLGIPFEPREKLGRLGTSDVTLSFLPGREVDLVVPNTSDPKILVQCTYYQSITGSIAQKMTREVRGTKRDLDRYNQSTGRSILLVGLVDGIGWLGMHSILKKILGTVDDFFQLKTLESKFLPILEQKGIERVSNATRSSQRRLNELL